jgi:hypothetical protein
MPIDPSIAMGVRPVQTPNMLANYAQAQEIGVNQLKMQEAQQSIENRNFIRGLDPDAPDYISKIMQRDPKLGMELRKNQLEGKKGQVELEANLMKNARNTLAPINDQGTYDLWRQQTISQLPSVAQFLPAKFDKDVKTALMLEADKYITQTQISASQQQTADVSKRGQDMTYGATIRGQNLSNDPELQARIAAGRASGTEYGKAGAQANIALPGAIATGEEAIRKIDALVGSAPIKNAEGKIIQAGTKPAAGFEQAVGLGIPGLKYIPGSSVADFNARLNEVQGGAFLQAFNTLRGGGSITEKEGEKGTQAINRMSTAQSEKEFNIAAREYQDVIRTGIARAKAKAANIGGGGATPSPTGEIDFNSLK